LKARYMPISFKYSVVEGTNLLFTIALKIENYLVMNN